LSISSFLANHMQEDDPWIGTLSNEIFCSLEQNYIGKKVRVQNRNTSHEIFCLDQDQANLYKILEEGSVGKTNGIIRTYVEQYEYHHKKWWQKVINPFHQKKIIRLLPISLTQLALDANLEDQAWMFSPEKVIERFCLKGNQDKMCVISAKIEDTIKSSFKKLCPKDFGIRRMTGMLRLIPLNNGARVINLDRNFPYRNLVQQAKELPVSLKNSLDLL